MLHLLLILLISKEIERLFVAREEGQAEDLEQEIQSIVFV